MKNESSEKAVVGLVVTIIAMLFVVVFPALLLSGGEVHEHEYEVHANIVDEPENGSVVQYENLSASTREILDSAGIDSVKTKVTLDENVTVSDGWQTTKVQDSWVLFKIEHSEEYLHPGHILKILVSLCSALLGLYLLAGSIPVLFAGVRELSSEWIE